MSGTVPSMSDPNTLGTNSIRHTWAAYIGGLLPSLFTWTWCLLGFVGVLNAITHTWDLLLLSSCAIFLGLVLIVANVYMSKDLLNGGTGIEETIQRSSLINDLEFAKFYTMVGICFFALTLAVYIEFHEVDGNTTYPHGWYVSNVTNISGQQVYTTRGTMKLIVGKITMIAGFLLSFFCVAKFFSTEQGGIIAMVYAALFGKGGYKSFASPAAATVKNRATSTLINS